MGARGAPFVQAPVKTMQALRRAVASPAGACP
jgi:hypothetical protein